MINKRRLIILSFFLPLVFLTVQPASARLKLTQPTTSYTYTAPTSTPETTPATTTETAAATTTTTAETTTTPAPVPTPAPTPTNIVSGLATQLDSLLKQLIALLTTQLNDLKQQLAAKISQEPATTPTPSPSATATTTAETAATSTVAENKPPKVNIATPYSGLALLAPASADIIASAFDEDGSISQVEFFADGSSLGVVKGANGPWRIGWSGNAGTYSFTAKATDDKGASATSAPVELRVKLLSETTGGVADIPPTVTIAGFPASASTTQSISIVATAATYAGSISQVVFYKASSNTAGVISTDLATPFQVSTTLGATGAWTISATATNSQGSTQNSGSSTVNIGPT